MDFVLTLLEKKVMVVITEFGKIGSWISADVDGLLGMEGAPNGIGATRSGRYWSVVGFLIFSKFSGS